MENFFLTWKCITKIDFKEIGLQGLETITAMLWGGQGALEDSEAK